MNSSASTDVFSSTSTRSMAMVGISARTTRRNELANARSTFLRTKFTRTLFDCEVATFVSPTTPQETSKTEADRPPRR